MSVIFQQGDWYKVSINGEEGYIHTSLITMGTYVPPVAAPAPAASASSGSVPAYVPDANASKASQVVSLAMSFVGSRYVYGGASPSTGFDCSGFTSYIYRQFGVSLYRSSTEQVKNGTVFSKEKPTIWICSNCGYSQTSTEAPDECPVCSHSKAYFYCE